MEELRPCFADRFVLTLINNRVLKAIDFDFRESGAVLLTDSGRRTFLQKWQERKKETITHPFLEEKIPWGLVPYVQSLLLARYLRGDLDDYPPFEEMLCCEIPRGALYYGEPRRRTEVDFTSELRQEVRALLEEMHALYARGSTPKVKPTKGCNACSLKGLCLPKLMRSKSVSAYLRGAMEGEQ